MKHLMSSSQSLQLESQSPWFLFAVDGVAVLILQSDEYHIAPMVKLQAPALSQNIEGSFKEAREPEDSTRFLIQFFLLIR